MIYGTHDFDGRRVHIVQIGLGTNSTFIQNFASSRDWDKGLDWILQIVSDVSPECLTGVAVEPASEHVESLLPWVRQSLPCVALVQQAIGDMDGNSRLFKWPKHKHQALIRQVPSWQRCGLEWSLSYLLNMSCVGQQHPDMQHYLDSIRRNYGVQLDLEQDDVGVWTWSRLAQKLNFNGCEVLIVDTEGFDARILRSMIKHCSARERASSGDAWPYVIQFETQGHCDKLEGGDAEWDIIAALQKVGYILVHYSYYNTHLARTNELFHNGHVKYWAGSLICSRCWKRHCYPYLTSQIDRNIYCRACSASWA